MSQGTQNPQRDTRESVFCNILTRIESLCVGFEAAVFFDENGETIDYHSYLDPFETKLAGAHHGVIVSAALHKMRWLGFGEVECIEIFADQKESITYVLGEGYFLTIIVKTGTMSDAFTSEIADVISAIKEEAGIA